MEIIITHIQRLCSAFYIEYSEYSAQHRNRGVYSTYKGQFALRVQHDLFRVSQVTLMICTQTSVTFWLHNVPTFLH